MLVVINIKREYFDEIIFFCTTIEQDPSLCVQPTDYLIQYLGPSNSHSRQTYVINLYKNLKGEFILKRANL